MKYVPVVAVLVMALCFGVVTTTEAAIDEGFDNFQDGERPVGWTFTHCNENTSAYTAAGYWGIASPSIRLKATTDGITTCEFGTAGNLQFWVRSLASNQSSSLLIEQLAGSWSTLTNIIGLPESATTWPAMALNGSTSQVKFTYTRVGAGETKIVIDDINITGATTPTPSPAPALAPTPIHLAVAWDDYNGDIYTDYALFNAGTWDIFGCFSGAVITEGVVWGNSEGDVPAPGDYDGDGVADIAYYNRISSQWNVMKVDGTIITTGLEWGIYGDMPVPEDYDGDGTTDYATLSPSGGILYWHVLGAATAWESYGYTGDIPMAGDYDGDGTCDKAVVRRRPTLLRWLIKKSSGGNQAFNWGYNDPGDLPTALDYDGDNVTDATIVRDSGVCIRWFPKGNTSVFYGYTTDVPVVGDFDGDGAYNVGVFRGSNGTWYIWNPAGANYKQVYGQDGDLPVVGQTY